MLAGLWNVDDDRVGWVAELAAISKRKSSVTLMRWRDSEGWSRQERLVEAGAGLFHAAEEGEFGHGQARTADSLLATIGTHSHLLVMEEAERARLLARVRDFLRTRPETSTRRIHAADGHRRAAGAAQLGFLLQGMREMFNQRALTFLLRDPRRAGRADEIPGSGPSTP